MIEKQKKKKRRIKETVGKSGRKSTRKGILFICATNAQFMLRVICSLLAPSLFVELYKQRLGPQEIKFHIHLNVSTATKYVTTF